MERIAYNNNKMRNGGGSLDFNDREFYARTKPMQNDSSSSHFVAFHISESSLESPRIYILLFQYKFEQEKKCLARIGFLTSDLSDHKSLHSNQ